ncbi:hypothetical protein [Thermococcus profundus]|uniref:hypothetical protein n=1 Tax=Thermococcus profundus TaxID=49899 RepID=UPI0012FDE943|nr:hypothetical protein [Thermococcus profundus]
MTSYSNEDIKNTLKQYFNRVSILTTQVPIQLREVLLPEYMLYQGFKSVVYIDDSGKVGFEILRKRASRVSIKIKKTKKNCGGRDIRDFRR